jgi:putative hydrolase of the HAD superfamily
MVTKVGLAVTIGLTVTPASRDALPPTLLLDLDDTILDDAIHADECWQRIAGQFAPQFAPASAEDFQIALGRVRRWYWDDPERNRVNRLRLRAARREIVTDTLIALGAANAPLAARIAEQYDALREAEARALPGALAALDQLHVRGIRLGLITNGEAKAQRLKIARFNLASYFQVIVIEGEFGCGKPDERVYRRALDALKATSATTWMVGDNLINDVLAPQRLGLTGIWVNATNRSLPSDVTDRPARIIRAVADLI